MTSPEEMPRHLLMVYGPPDLGYDPSRGDATSPADGVWKRVRWESTPPPCMKPHLPLSTPCQDQ